MATTDTLTAEMAGTRGHLLTLVIKTTALTVLTFGLYSFWARTRIRRWIWSSFRVGGVPFEYAGRPLEKLMGFVIAAVIVAIYLGIVVMLLIFASLNLTGAPTAGTIAAFVLLLPVYWFAKYRGQRYLLNHTRWRGIAFSMEPGAAGYAARAVGWSLATILTMGIMLPLRTHQLWKYRAERTFYGNQRFRFTASVRNLYAPFALVLVGLYGTVLLTAMSEAGYEAAPLGVFVMVMFLLWAWVRWRVVSFRILASGLGCGDEIALRVAPRTGAVIGVHLLGWLLMGALLIAIVIGLAVATGALAAGTLAQVDWSALEDVSPYFIALGAGLFYLTFFVLRGALRIAMVTFPLFRHVAGTLDVTEAGRVHTVARGASAHMADADGFANLFDMGSGI